MTPEQWERLKAVFQGALEQPPDRRRTWVVDACAGDDTLVREAYALLDAHQSSDGFLEQPAQVVPPGDGDALPPDTQLGPYRIIEEIARGGMGIVYLAEDSRLGRRVAVKALPAVVSAHAGLRERLRREARAVATISHPGVATVYALEEIDEHLVIVSEYVPGETLRAVLSRGPLEADRVRVIAIQIARALSAAHGAGVVHRDLKPENILITPGGDVKVVDFGIAHVEGPEAMRLTRTGAMLGTPAYMAPEQLLGGDVDPRADIYALGVVISEMLTGRHPLAEPASAAATAGARTDSALRLAAIAVRCMQPDPAARYPTARELLAALDGQDPVDAPSRWWWDFHQAMAALVYWLMAVPAWQAREAIGGTPGRVFFIVTLAAVVVAANLRLHLWFMSRSYPDQLRWARRRARPWIRGADWMFVAALVTAGLVVERAPLAVLLLSVGIGAALAFLLIEPATTRAAFRSSSTSVK